MARIKWIIATIMIAQHVSAQEMHNPFELNFRCPAQLPYCALVNVTTEKAIFYFQSKKYRALIKGLLDDARQSGVLVVVDRTKLVNKVIAFESIPYSCALMPCMNDAGSIRKSEKLIKFQWKRAKKENISIADFFIHLAVITFNDQTWEWFFIDELQSTMMQKKLSQNEGEFLINTTVLESLELYRGSTLAHEIIVSAEDQNL